MLKISFLSSHGGSSMKFIINAVHNKQLTADIGAIIINNRDAEAFAWAERQGLAPVHISSNTHADKNAEDLAMLKVLQAADSDYVVLSGYMKKIGPATLTEFAGKILNIHPALLPKFGGQGMYGDHVHQAVLQAGENYSGATVHFVTNEYDQGPIILQRRFALRSDETLDTLRKKVKGVEGELYLAALRKLLVHQPVSNANNVARIDFREQGK